MVVRDEKRDSRLRPADEHGAADVSSAGAAELKRLEDGGARIHNAWHTWRVPTAPAATVSRMNGVGAGCMRAIPFFAWWPGDLLC